MSKRKRKYKRSSDFSSSKCELRIMNILAFFDGEPVRGKVLEQKCLRGSKNVSEFRAALRNLEERGKIYRSSRGYVRTKHNDSFFKAKITRLNRTFGFMERCDSGEEIFVPGKYLMGALAEDIVMAKYIGDDRESPEGRVVGIVKAGAKSLSGVIIEDEGRKVFLADTMSNTPIPIVKGDVEFEAGDKVLAQLAFRGERHADHKAKVIMNFGSAFKASNCAEAVVTENGVVPEFPDEVIESARAICDGGITPEDIRGRLDLRNEVIFTIDSAESKDLDDAVSLSRSGNGYRLGVHIADVSHYVRGGGAIDEEALERGTSIYYADKVIPMLPKELSNGICSLNPDEDRLTFSAIMNISGEGEILDFRFEKSVIRSRVKGIYSEINAILDGSADDSLTEKYSGLEDTLRLMEELSDILIKRRRNRGAPNIETTESKLVIRDDICVDVKPRTRGKSEVIIETFMLAANESAARLAREKELPFVYRVHEPPAGSRMDDLKEGLLRLNIEVPVFSEAKPAHIAQILENAKENPAYPVVSMMTLRAMTKAWYGPEPKGHFGLALDDYAHFTSPIRRYPDLAIHRILTDYVNGADCERLAKRYGEFVQRASRRSSETEMRAMTVERSCEECYKAEYMQKHLGEAFEGMISSVAEYGFYVELPNTVEGLVHVTVLPDGTYSYDGFFSLREELSNTVYSVGDKVCVECVGADVNTGKIDFRIKDKE